MSNTGKTISLELRGVAKNFGPFEALGGIDLTVTAGEFIVIVGPSGCGKSTLLKAIAGLEDLTSGEILIHGRDVTNEEPGSRGIAMVFQSYALYPHMTVAENMGFGLRMARRPRAEIDAAVTRAAKILRITDQLDKRPKQLSGGQRQRVAIGRAITRSPEVFLFDEPLSNLDAALRMQMRVELGTLHAELGATMVYVTHDQIEAMTMASRIVVLNAGRIEQVGSPLELYANPGNLFVAGFLGAPRMNFINAKVTAINGAGVLVEAPGLRPIELVLADGISLDANSPVTVGIRPEHVKVGNQHFSVPATVRLVERLGRETFLYVDASPLVTKGSDTGRADVTVHIAETASFAQGQSLVLTFDPRDALLFGPDGQRLTPAKRLASS